MEAWVDVRMQRNTLFAIVVNTRADKLALWGNEGKICQNGNI